MPQTYFPQPGRGFGGLGGFRGLSPLPPSAASPFSLSGMFQPYSGKDLTFGKTFPGFFPSSIPIKTPPAPCTTLDDLPLPKPDLKDSGSIDSSAPGDSIPSESKK
jgi:hypothetical protein